MACAICTMSIHLFGDVPSPILVGFIQDKLSNWNQTMIILTTFLLPSAIIIIILYWNLKFQQQIEPYTQKTLTQRLISSGSR